MYIVLEVHANETIFPELLHPVVRNSLEFKEREGWNS